jgi:uncharacterized protein involved in exopolysaccharide biosynthesis
MGPITSFADLLRAFWRRAWLIMTISVIGTGLSLLYAWTREHSWEATAVIQIEMPRVADTLAAGSAPSTTTLIELVEQQVMSRDRIIALIETFEPFPAGWTLTEKVGAMRGAVRMVELIDPAMAWRPDVQPTGLSITVELGEAQVAADVANAIVDSIVGEAQSRVSAQVTATLDFLVAEEARIRGEIEGIEDDIATFRQTNMASLPEGLTAQRERLADLNASLLAIDQEILALDNASARQRPEEVERQRTLLAGQQDLLRANAAEIEAAIAATPGVERELGAMTRKLTQHEAELEVVTARRTEAAMTQLLESQDQTSRLVVLEHALPPEFPSSRSRKKIAMAGAVASVMMAFGVALALELMSQGIRSAAQMRRELGIDPVVVIPRLTPRRRGGGGISRWLAALLAALGAAAAAIWAITRWGLIDRIGALLPRRGARPDRLLDGGVQPAE